MSRIGDGDDEGTVVELEGEYATTPAEGLGEGAQDPRVGWVETEVPVGHPGDFGQCPGQVVLEQDIVGHQDLTQPFPGSPLLVQGDLHLLFRHEAGRDQLVPERRTADVRPPTAASTLVGQVPLRHHGHAGLTGHGVGANCADLSAAASRNWDIACASRGLANR